MTRGDFVGVVSYVDRPDPRPRFGHVQDVHFGHTPNPDVYVTFIDSWQTRQGETGTFQAWSVRPARYTFHGPVVL